MPRGTSLSDLRKQANAKRRGKQIKLASQNKPGARRRALETEARQAAGTGTAQGRRQASRIKKRMQGGR